MTFQRQQIDAFDVTRFSYDVSNRAIRTAAIDLVEVARERLRTAIEAEIRIQLQMPSLRVFIESELKTALKDAAAKFAADKIEELMEEIL